MTMTTKDLPQDVRAALIAALKGQDGEGLAPAAAQRLFRLPRALIADLLRAA